MMQKMQMVTKLMLTPSVAEGLVSQPLQGKDHLAKMTASPLSGPRPDTSIASGTRRNTRRARGTGMLVQTVMMTDQRLLRQLLGLLKQLSRTVAWLILCLMI